MSKFVPISFVVWLVLGVGIAAAQDRAASHIPYAFSEMPKTSEFNIISLEVIAKDALIEAERGNVTVAIARLGDGERSREINRRRLHNVQAFLTNYPNLNSKNVIVAQGERVRGYGRVEIYVAGKLLDVMLVERNKDLHVDCCEGNFRYYPDMELMRRRKPKR